MGELHENPGWARGEINSPTAAVCRALKAKDVKDLAAIQALIMSTLGLGRARGPQFGMVVIEVSYNNVGPGVDLE